MIRLVLVSLPVAEGHGIAAEVAVEGMIRDGKAASPLVHIQVAWMIFAVPLHTYAELAPAVAGAEFAAVDAVAAAEDHNLGIGPEECLEEELAFAGVVAYAEVSLVHAGECLAVEDCI